MSQEREEGFSFPGLEINIFENVAAATVASSSNTAVSKIVTVGLSAKGDGRARVREGEGSTSTSRYNKRCCYATNNATSNNNNLFITKNKKITDDCREDTRTTQMLEVATGTETRQEKIEAQ